MQTNPTPDEFELDVLVLPQTNRPNIGLIAFKFVWIQMAT